MDPLQVAELKLKARMFVERYYHDLDYNKSELKNRYQEGSSMNFQGKQIDGAEEISGFLTRLPVATHHISTFDCQISHPAGAILVLVYGMLVLASQVHHSKFSQMFYLMPTQNDFYVASDMFQLIYDY